MDTIGKNKPIRLKITVLADRDNGDNYFVDYYTPQGKKDYLQITEKAFLQGQTVIVKPIANQD